MKRLVCAAASAALAISFAALAQPQFEREIVDSTFFGEGIAIGDIDADDNLDIVVAGKQLVWYKNPEWTKTVVAEPVLEFLADVQAVDLDNDDDLDLVTSDGGGIGNIIWFANPRIGGGSEWTRHVIGSHGEFKYDWATEVKVGDLDTNGTMEVITRGSSLTHIWFDSSETDLDAPWLDRNITFSTMKDLQSLLVADINQDARADLIMNGYFLQTPSFSAIEGEYTSKFIMSGWPLRTTPGVGDIDGDGVMEVAFTVADNTSRIAIYSTASTPPGTQWTEHAVYPSTGYVRSMKIADMDGNDRRDIVFAEMKGYVESRVAYLSSGASLEDEWTLRVIDSCGSYNIQVADLDKNNKIDIVGCNIGEGPVYVWKNVNEVKAVAPVSRQEKSARFIMACQDGVLSVAAPGAFPFEASVINTQGRTVHRFNAHSSGTFNLSQAGLGTGTYIIEVRGDNLAQSARFAVSK